VSALCDTIVVIAGGKVVAHGTADDLRARAGHDSLEDAFVALAGSGEPR
jgi:sodium transport system ATP-binding protein